MTMTFVRLLSGEAQRFKIITCELETERDRDRDVKSLVLFVTIEHGKSSSPP